MTCCRNCVGRAISVEVGGAPGARKPLDISSSAWAKVVSRSQHGSIRYRMFHQQRRASASFRGSQSASAKSWTRQPSARLYLFREAYDDAQRKSYRGPRKLSRILGVVLLPSAHKRVHNAPLSLAIMARLANSDITVALVMAMSNEEHSCMLLAQHGRSKKVPYWRCPPATRPAVLLTVLYQRPEDPTMESDGSRPSPWGRLPWGLSCSLWRIES